MTPAEEIQAMFARAIDWDVLDALTDEEIEAAYDAAQKEES